LKWVTRPETHAIVSLQMKVEGCDRSKTFNQGIENKVPMMSCESNEGFDAIIFLDQHFFFSFFFFSNF
jgi:hypothetical protein